MSAGGAKESFAAPRLARCDFAPTAPRPWLPSAAAPRLNKDAAPPRYYFEVAKLFWTVLVYDRPFSVQISKIRAGHRPPLQCACASRDVVWDSAASLKYQRAAVASIISTFVAT